MVYTNCWLSNGSTVAKIRIARGSPGQHPIPLVLSLPMAFLLPLHFPSLAADEGSYSTQQELYAGTTTATFPELDLAKMKLQLHKKE